MTDPSEPAEQHPDDDAIDLGEEHERAPQALLEAQASPHKILQLARETLAGLGVFALITEAAYCGMNYLGPSNDTKVFETLLVTVLPSLVTLIVGFYFGKKAV